MVVVRGNAGFWHLLHASGLPLAEQGVMGGCAEAKDSGEQGEQQEWKKPILRSAALLIPFLTHACKGGGLGGTSGLGSVAAGTGSQVDVLTVRLPGLKVTRDQSQRC